MRACEALRSSGGTGSWGGSAPEMGAFRSAAMRSLSSWDEMKRATESASSGESAGELADSLMRRPARRSSQWHMREIPRWKSCAAAPTSITLKTARTVSILCSLPGGLVR